MKGEKYCLKFINHFPEIEPNILREFYFTPKNKKISDRLSIQFALKWTKLFGIQKESLTLNMLLDYHEKRCNRLESSILSHPSVIDISLF